MKRFRSITVVLIGLVCAAAFAGPVLSAGPSAGTASAAPKQRQYKCTKCREIHTFDRPGNYKCPKCGKNLIPVT